jgi:predicted RNase H-like HicB family nuclease
MRQIIIHKADDDETGFWAECPSLGVVSQGETIEETLSMIKEAIDLWITVTQEAGGVIPKEDGEEIDRAVVLV